jgi:TfoX/Sxy family transcriptional regulator of competence genes
VAYHEALAQRFRDVLKGVKGVTERRMMGGLCLLVNGNMLGGVDRAKSGRDRFMFRVGKDNEAKALRRPGASIVDMGGKRLGGLIFVDADKCDDDALKGWIELSLGFVGRLPKK